MGNCTNIYIKELDTTDKSIIAIKNGKHNLVHVRYVKVIYETLAEYRLEYKCVIAHIP